ncbi:MAG TPA: hypothetical protein VD788_00770 [Candidatus Polarisedimenticolaceae bacterium]|nr:hypothetical protein [Candidatus Polarisedimenticolaceae bacterium]
MKRASIVLALVLGLVAMPILAGDAAKGKTHDVTVEFVSYDAEGKTVTFKTEAGEQKTAPVQDSVVKMLEKVHAGDKVVLTCQDSESGEHEAVTAVKPAKAEKKA